MRTLLAIGLLLLPLAGCTSCSPTLDVRHCPQAVGGCDPGDAQVIEWSPDLQGLFPDVHRLVTTLADGEHGHARWSQAETDAFWRFNQVDPGTQDKQVFLSQDGDLFRVRVLAC